MASGEEAVCDRIMRALPDWFGLEEAIVQYVADLETMETWMVLDDAVPVGFITVHTHNEYSAEIHAMAIDRQHHSHGLGRMLVSHVEDVLRSRGVEYLQVKTLGPSRPDPNYARTRGFYLAMGFRPLEENSLWGDVNPCLIQVKRIPDAPAPGDSRR